MSNYRPIDSKREEFRKYLERAGVMDALTKVLVSLYEEAEKPDDALDYVRKHLDGSGPDSEDIEAIKAELDVSKTKIEELEQENATLKDKLLQYEGPRGENAQREDAQAADSVAPNTEEEEGGPVSPGPSE